MEKFEFRNIYFWMHTSFSAVSIAFFLSLLSAQQTTIDALSIVVASVFFCISVISNAGLSFFLALFGQSDMYVDRLYVTLYPWLHLNTLPAMSIYSFIFGIVSLLSYYSYFFAVIAVTLIFYTAIRIQSEIRKANHDALEKIQNIE